MKFVFNFILLLFLSFPIYGDDENAGCVIKEGPNFPNAACEKCVCKLLPWCCSPNGKAWLSYCIDTCKNNCEGCGTLKNCGDGVCKEEDKESCFNCNDCKCGEGLKCNVKKNKKPFCEKDLCYVTKCDNGEVCDPYSGKCIKPLITECKFEKLSLEYCPEGFSEGDTCCDEKGRVLRCDWLADDLSGEYIVKKGLLCEDCPNKDPECGWVEDFKNYGCGTDGGEDPTGKKPKSCYVPKPEVQPEEIVEKHYTIVEYSNIDIVYEMVDKSELEPELIPDEFKLETIQNGKIVEKEKQKEGKGCSCDLNEKIRFSKFFIPFSLFLLVFIFHYSQRCKNNKSNEGKNRKDITNRGKLY